MFRDYVRQLDSREQWKESRVDKVEVKSKEDFTDHDNFDGL